MKVIKRDGSSEPIKFDKISARIKKQTYGLNTDYVDYMEVTQKVIAGIFDGITTKELDNLAAEIAASLTRVHYDYSKLASRISISSLKKYTKKSFTETIEDLYHYVNPITGEQAGLIADNVYNIVRENSKKLEQMIVHDRDFDYDFFGFKTLERAYLLKINNEIAETPQHMCLRVSLGIWGDNLKEVQKTYDSLSKGLFTHATPTLFNSGTKKPQLSSCFVAGTSVFTTSGVKNIEDVEIGDKVVTHKGNVKEVQQLHKNKLNDRQLYDLKTYGSPNMTVTGNHRILSLSKEQDKWGKTPKWNSVEYLRVGDYVAIPNKIGKYAPEKVELIDYVPNNYGNIELESEIIGDKLKVKSKWLRRHKLNNNGGNIIVTRKHNEINKSIIIDEDFAFLLGVWIGDGNILTGKDYSKTLTVNRGIRFTNNKDAYGLIDRLDKLITKIFGIDGNISKPTKTNTITIDVHSHVISNYFYKNFGKGFNGKKIPDFMYNWDKLMISKFLEGLITSDGCVTKSGDIRITMANIDLIKSIFALSRNCGIPLSYSEATSLKLGGTKLTARISLPKGSIDLSNIYKLYNDERLSEYFNKSNKNSNIKIINGTTFIIINKKSENISKPEFVYTLGVQDDHSYVVEGNVVENCFLLGMADDSIKGIYESLSDCADISQSAGGIGIHIHNVRAKGTYIKGTNGTSNGIVPMLRVYNETARYVDQCFTEETLINTDKGLIKIKDISEGDKVKTSNGFNKVKKVKKFNKEKRELINVNGKTKSTVSHPYLVVEDSTGRDLEIIKLSIKSGTLIPKWVEAKDLNKNMFILK